LFGYGQTEQLKRIIKCEGLKNRFIIEPRILDFKKKIIRNNNDKNMPSFIEMTLTNPDIKSLYWKMDVSHLEPDNIFSMLPVEGRIDGNQSVIVKVCFNPAS
jgi:hypothetical protein